MTEMTVTDTDAPSAEGVPRGLRRSITEWFSRGFETLLDEGKQTLSKGNKGIRMIWMEITEQNVQLTSKYLGSQ